MHTAPRAAGADDSYQTTIRRRDQRTRQLPSCPYAPPRARAGTHTRAHKHVTSVARAQDTGDPGGDIGFGLWEIAMPMGCRAAHHMNIGCTNGTGDYIHPGDPTNVYEKFTVEMNPLVGLYHNCNPDPKYTPSGAPDPTAGVFDCDSEDGFDSAHCICPGATAVTWQDYYSDCLNGTVYKHVGANISACEAECAADKVCAAVAMQDGRGGSSCNLLKQPLIQWDDGRDKSKGMCAASIKQETSNNLPSTECACYKFNHVAVGKQSQGSGLAPGMPCGAFNSSGSCQSYYSSGRSCRWKPACCKWDGKDWDCSGCTDATKHDPIHGSCQESTCGNRTDADDCNDSYECRWNDTAAASPAEGFCGAFTCGNYTGNATMCEVMKSRGCYYDKGKSLCAGGYSHNSGGWGQQARETAEDLMAGHWYSTQSQGHCNGTNKECSWRLAAVEKVVNASCVNGKIVAEVEKVNASCFDKLDDPKNVTTDGWIECFFQGLFGNSSIGAPALGGNRLQTVADAAALRQKIMDLWLGAFTSDDPTEGGCPAVTTSKNAPDPVASSAIAGIETKTLYVKGAEAAESLVNRNSQDSAAVILSAILQQEEEEEGSAAPPGAVMTSVSVELNSFYGQYAACKNNGTAFTCAADWECWCQSYHSGNGDENPCEGEDDRRVCPCKLWGGCGGGQWPVESDSSVAVGRKSLKAPAGTAAAAVAAAATTTGLLVRALTEDGDGGSVAHEYSTTAGGNCDGPAANPIAPDGLCTWSAADAASSSSSWQHANTQCVETLVLTAINAAAAGAAAASGGSAAHVDAYDQGVDANLLVVAGEAALAEAFAPGSPCRIV